MKNIIKLIVILFVAGVTGYMLDSDLIVSSSNPFDPPPAGMAGLNFAEEVDTDEINVKTADQVSVDGDLLAHVSLDNEIQSNENADKELPKTDAD